MPRIAVFTERHAQNLKAADPYSETAAAHASDILYRHRGRVLKLS